MGSSGTPGAWGLLRTREGWVSWNRARLEAKGVDESNGGRTGMTS